jgi:hypothetical protein
MHQNHAHLSFRVLATRMCERSGNTARQKNDGFMNLRQYKRMLLAVLFLSLFFV